MSECGASTTLCAIIININIIIMIVVVVVVVVVASHSQRMHQEHHRRSNRQSLLRQTQNLKPKNVCSTSSLLLLNALTFMLAFAILPYAKRNILFLLLHERCMSTYTMYVDCRLPSRMGYSFVYISEWGRQLTKIYETFVYGSLRGNRLLIREKMWNMYFLCVWMNHIHTRLRMSSISIHSGAQTHHTHSCRPHSPPSLQHFLAHEPAHECQSNNMLL